MYNKRRTKKIHKDNQSLQTRTRNSDGAQSANSVMFHPVAWMPVESRAIPGSVQLELSARAVLDLEHDYWMF